MNKNKMYLDHFKSISEEVKYLSNSIVRLKILAMLDKKPRKIKEINDSTQASYSSISANIHNLELGEYVYLKSNRYHVSNAVKIIIKNIWQMDQLMNVIDSFFIFFDDHFVNVFPDQSISDLYLLNNAKIIESDDINAYKTYNYMEKSLKSAKRVRCILPFFQENINDILNGLVDNNRSVEVLVADDVYEIFDKYSKIKKLLAYEKKNNFLLISTDKVMILGLFKKSGHFDQNRLLIARDKNSISWANDLFFNFKEKYK